LARLCGNQESRAARSIVDRFGGPHGCLRSDRVGLAARELAVAMVLSREVGSARVTITDVATKQILATGIQQGEVGDQNHEASSATPGTGATMRFFRP